MNQPTGEEAIYNVVVTVIDLVPAASEADAIAKLTARLEHVGFEVHKDGGDTQSAFESEPLGDLAEATRQDWKIVKRAPKASR